MPTDPYVAPDLDESPRHKQNLPAGVAVPPPASWVPHRPGELGPDAPAGELFGRPGPNIGYALTLAERVHGAWVLGPDEQLADADAVVAEIAMKRAAGLGRAPVRADVDVAVALLGYGGPIDRDWAAARSRLVRGSEHHYVARRRVVDAVPDGLLRLHLQGVHAAAPGWRVDTARGLAQH